ncbi:MAG: hypothetical protein IIT82_01305 [Selenomonas sp.]|jgi:hypothetical protein|uniref:hypothetical protein n=1 Tax=Selenomonas sp. AE3005 TaxID=1485543 RepID=UPI000481B4FD|nr:hypothetical protein [Selenomonas sp. AE3005]MBQ1417275.1 hypothetical protein [Selenomonas sp.]MBQ1461437.1 hypothetical protein [Selenomonas sp.]MBQ1614323.1 hypothetical protein [Selenomonas sp.]MBQ1808126.1 hypothetical protein [Selenomonas sp.]MBQ1920306.1 hypothetical protein [Selenomonas sp.]
MKEVLSVFMKRLIMGLGVITLAIGSMLAANGTVELIGALIIGFVTGLVFLGNMSMRLWKAASLSAGNAKRQMLWGLVLRLMVLFIVLFAAVQISTQVFSMVALGFVLCYAWAMVLMIRMNNAK